MRSPGVLGLVNFASMVQQPSAPRGHMDSDRNAAIKPLLPAVPQPVQKMAQSLPALPPAQLEPVVDGFGVSNDQLLAIGRSLGGENVSVEPGRQGKSANGILHFEMTMKHPKTGEALTRYYSLATPGSLAVNERRLYASILKGGNPATYGSTQLSSQFSQTVKRKAALEKALDSELVLTIRDQKDSPFCALATLKPNKHTRNTADLGRVTIGPSHSKQRGTEKLQNVKGAGSDAVGRLLEIGALLGFEVACLYTNSPDLGERREDSDSGELLPSPFYDRIADKLGLDAAYESRTVLRDNLAQACDKIKLPNNLVLQVEKPQFHYAYPISSLVSDEKELN